MPDPEKSEASVKATESAQGAAQSTASSKSAAPRTAVQWITEKATAASKWSLEYVKQSAYNSPGTSSTDAHFAPLGTNSALLSGRDFKTSSGSKHSGEERNEKT